MRQFFLLILLAIVVVQVIDMMVHHDSGLDRRGQLTIEEIIDDHETDRTVKAAYGRMNAMWGETRD
jgi:hypothetical protein